MIREEPFFFLDFVTVEEHYRIMLKSAWRMSQSIVDFSGLNTYPSKRQFSAFLQDFDHHSSQTNLILLISITNWVDLCYFTIFSFRIKIHLWSFFGKKKSMWWNKFYAYLELKRTEMIQQFKEHFHHMDFFRKMTTGEFLYENKIL